MNLESFRNTKFASAINLVCHTVPVHIQALGNFFDRDIFLCRMYGRLIETIIEWSDEFYSYNLAQEVRRGMTEKAMRGGYQCKPPIVFRLYIKL